MMILRITGRSFLGFLAYLGQVSFFAGKATLACLTPKFYVPQIMIQLFRVGYLSLPVIGLTAIFSGMVLALQSYTGFSRFSAGNAIASVVVITMTRELGPVLGALMVAGRVGAAMAAELGTMRVTEQIDALLTLSTNPFHYLVAPRLWAAVISLPILVLCADAIGVYGGYVVAVHKLDFNGALYMEQTFKHLEASDVTSGLIKAAVFGYLIGLMACFYGYFSKGGALGVGQATTKAVVASSVLIFLFNYLLTAILFA